MKQSYFPLGVIAATMFGALIGIVLRIYQLSNCMEENGLVRVGSPILYILLAVALLFSVAIGLFCSKLNRTLGTEKDLCGSPAYLFVDLAGAVCVFYGSLQRLVEGGVSMEYGTLLLFVGGMSAALFLAAASMLYGKKSKVVIWLLLLCCIFFAAQLIYDFKNWSTDPLVIDFCFRLLAQVSGMLALLHLAAFTLSYGRKRIAIFWSALALMFTLMQLPDLLLGKSLALGEFLIPLGTSVWCASHAVRLLRSSVQTAEEAEPAEMLEPAEDKAE